MKEAIRNDILAKRQALSKQEQQQAATKLAKYLVLWLLEHYPPSNHPIIAGYITMRGELDLLPTLTILAEKGYNITLPCIQNSPPPAPGYAEAKLQLRQGESGGGVGGGKILTFRHWQPQDRLVSGPFNTQQPITSAPIATPTLLCVPLVAADKQLNRLGYGGGYYDATITHLRNINSNLITIGIAYDFQLLDSLPTEAHDAPLDYLFTPTRHITA